MYKLVEFEPYFSDLEPSINLIEIDGSTAHLIKKAADQRVDDFVADLNPQPGKFYLHILAMGAGEYYGANRNADYFPEEQLKTWHKTFEETGHVFRNHINKDPARSMGKVIFSIYNERMHRVELVVEVDNVLGKDVADRIARGDYPATSMACKTPYDKCSICGNEASSRQAYCDHLKYELGKIKSDGTKVMAINVAPLRFFDISIVIKPADVTSSVLQKVASASNHVIGSIELAESEGLVEKKSSLRKLSELIKEVEGTVVNSIDGNGLDKIIDNTQDPSVEVIHALKDVPLNHILSSFVKLGISPSLRFLSELMAIKQFGSEAEGFGELAELTLKSTGVNDIPLPAETLMQYEEPHHTVLKVLAPYMEKSSYDSKYVEKRAALGYNPYGWNPQEKTRAPLGFEQSHSSLLPSMTKEQETGLFKTLLGIGVSAMLAKMFITREISNQLNDRAKIVIVKKAMHNDFAPIHVGKVNEPAKQRSPFLQALGMHLKNSRSSAANATKVVIRVLSVTPKKQNEGVTGLAVN